MEKKGINIENVLLNETELDTVNGGVANTQDHIPAFIGTERQMVAGMLIPDLYMLPVVSLEMDQIDIDFKSPSMRESLNPSAYMPAQGKGPFGIKGS